MRIRSDAELNEMAKSGKTTRAARAAAKAAARIKARHVERDYFGRPLEPIGPAPDPADAPGRQGVRLDAWLVANGLSPSREKAKELIASGAVSVNGSAKVKPSTPVTEGAQVVVAQNPQEQ